MTLAALPIIISRIEVATPESPIAVFQTGKEEMLDCMFASTIETAKRINGGDPKLVGVFDNTQDKYEISRILRAALAENIPDIA